MFVKYVDNYRPGYNVHAASVCGTTATNTQTPAVTAPAPAVDRNRMRLFRLRRQMLIPPRPRTNGSNNARWCCAVANRSGWRTTPVADPNALVMNFTADCWRRSLMLPVKNCLAVCSVKTVFELNRPGTVQTENWCASRSTIQYQGKPVDLSRFIRTNQVGV